MTVLHCPEKFAFLCLEVYFFLFNINISKGMKEKKKYLYEAPVIQVLELRQEGVICASPSTGETRDPWDNGD